MKTKAETELTKKARIISIVCAAPSIGLITWVLVKFGHYILDTFRWAAASGTAIGEWVTSLPLPLGIFLFLLILVGGIGVLYLLYKLIKLDVGRLGRATGNLEKGVLTRWIR